MRTGNTTDGMYFFLIVVPFVLSYLIGEFSRKKILSYLVLESCWSQNLSAFVGTLAEILIIISGICISVLLLSTV